MLLPFMSAMMLMQNEPIRRSPIMSPLPIRNMQQVRHPDQLLELNRASLMVLKVMMLMRLERRKRHVSSTPSPTIRGKVMLLLLLNLYLLLLLLVMSVPIRRSPTTPIHHRIMMRRL